MKGSAEIVDAGSRKFKKHMFTSTNSWAPRNGDFIFDESVELG